MKYTNMCYNYQNSGVKLPENEKKLEAQENLSKF